MFYSTLINQVQSETEKTFKTLELTTENITNASTPSYKSKRLSPFGQIIKKMDASHLYATGISNDVSIEGKGFFVLADENNKPLLVRNLSIHTDKDDYLISDDKFLFPKTKVVKPYPRYKVEPNGEVYGLSNDGTKALLTKLKVVHFAADEKLNFDGVFYRATADAGQPKELELGKNKDSIIRQKFHETSNVNSPIEFSNFNMTSQQLRVQSQLLSLLIQSQKSYIQNLSQMAQ